MWPHVRNYIAPCREPALPGLTRFMGSEPRISESAGLPASATYSCPLLSKARPCGRASWRCRRPGTICVFRLIARQIEATQMFAVRREFLHAAVVDIGDE